MSVQKLSINYLDLTREIVLNHIDCQRYNVFLFGSRAYGNAKPFSDIDVGVEGSEKLSSIIIAEIEEELEESIVPFKVDIVDFSRVSTTFKQQALKKIVKWSQ